MLIYIFLYLCEAVQWTYKYKRGNIVVIRSVCLPACLSKRIARKLYIGFGLDQDYWIRFIFSYNVGRLLDQIYIVLSHGRTIGSGLYFPVM